MLRKEWIDVSVVTLKWRFSLSKCFVLYQVIAPVFKHSTENITIVMDEFSASFNTAFFPVSIIGITIGPNKLAVAILDSIFEIAVIDGFIRVSAFSNSIHLINIPMSFVSTNVLFTNIGINLDTNTMSHSSHIWGSTWICGNFDLSWFNINWFLKILQNCQFHQPKPLGHSKWKNSWVGCR